MEKKGKDVFSACATPAMREILDACADMSVNEARCVRDAYVEVVIFTKDLGAWMCRLREKIGKPVKPEGKKPTPEDLRITDAHGGILKEQVLFRKECGSQEALIVMFWQWQDKVHTTIKMAFIKG